MLVRTVTSWLQPIGDISRHIGGKDMNRQTGMALGVGVGYLLGRSNKTRLALMLAAAGATGKLSLPGQLVRGATGQAGGALSKIAEDVPGRLLEAGKAAATAAATSKIDSLVDRVHNQTEALRRPSLPGDSEGEQKKTSERSRRDGPDNESDDDEDFDEAEEPARGRAESRDRRRPSMEDELDEEEEEEEEFAPTAADRGAGQRTDRRRPGDGRPRRSPESTGGDEQRSERRTRGRPDSERSESPIRRTRR